MLNPELKKGDRIVLLQMKDEDTIPPGTKGTVKKDYELFGEMQYSVEWDNGSTLNLLSSQDAWVYEEDYLKRRKKNIKENDLDKLVSNKDIFKDFDVRFLVSFMKKLRESGIVNMIGSSSYLWMGRDRIYHQNYNNPIAEDNEAYDELLDMANESQSKMISGVIKVLEKEGKEPELYNINRYLKKYADKIWDTYVFVMSR
jgi:uncharacterized protein YjgD (DUF1641 family)